MSQIKTLEKEKPRKTQIKDCVIDLLIDLIVISFYISLTIWGLTHLIVSIIHMDGLLKTFFLTFMCVLPIEGLRLLYLDLRESNKENAQNIQQENK